MTQSYICNKLILKSVLDGETDIFKEGEQSSKQQLRMENSNTTSFIDVGSAARVSIFILSLVLYF